MLDEHFDDEGALLVPASDRLEEPRRTQASGDDSWSAHAYNVAAWLEHSPLVILHLAAQFAQE